MSEKITVAIDGVRTKTNCPNTAADMAINYCMDNSKFKNEGLIVESRFGNKINGANMVVRCRDTPDVRAHITVRVATLETMIMKRIREVVDTWRVPVFKHPIMRIIIDNGDGIYKFEVKYSVSSVQNFIRKILNGEPDVIIKGEYFFCDSVVKFARKGKPGVVVMCERLFDKRDEFFTEKLLASVQNSPEHFKFLEHFL